MSRQAELDARRRAAVARYRRCDTVLVDEATAAGPHGPDALRAAKVLVERDVLRPTEGPIEALMRRHGLPWDAAAALWERLDEAGGICGLS